LDENKDISLKSLTDLLKVSFTAIICIFFYIIYQKIYVLDYVGVYEANSGVKTVQLIIGNDFVEVMGERFSCPKIRTTIIGNENQLEFTCINGFGMEYIHTMVILSRDELEWEISPDLTAIFTRASSIKKQSNEFLK
jgi:hypothetical protein